MLAEAQKIKAKLEEEQLLFNSLKKLGQMAVPSALLPIKKIAEGLRNNLALKLINVIFQVSSPIRSTGLIDVPVKIYQDVTGLINIRVNEG